ncbi:MAG: spore coat U domain-containing protein [Myxococcales bacterium]|jgi:spore coat protein U-like protein
MAAKRVLLASLAAALVAALGEPARSQKAGRARCEILSAVGPSFGNYNPLDAVPLDSAGNVSLRCENLNPSQTVVIELGRGRDNRVMPRAMRRRGVSLEYNLYLDAARTQIWGDGSRGTSTFEWRPVNGEVVSIPVYGRVPARQPATPGHYSDRIALIVQY